MDTRKRNLRYILLSALVILSLAIVSCNIFTLPSRLAGEVEAVATKVIIPKALTAEIVAALTSTPTPQPTPKPCLLYTSPSPRD